MDTEVRERERMEQALAARDPEFADLVQHGMLPLHEMDAHGVIVWANQAEFDLLGYAPTEYVGRHIADFHVDPPVCADLHARLLAGETIRDAPARLRCRNGDVKHVVINANTLWRDGRFVHSRTFTHDVTARVQVEEALREGAALRAEIVDSSDDAIVSKTLEGVVTSWNRGAARIFGYTAEEMIGRPITTIIPPELHAEEATILAQLARGERIEHYETIRVARDGRRLNISLTVSPVRNSRGRIVGASKVARDVTERKLAEQALLESERRLQQSQASLQEAARRKDEFLALLAHELRNPLAPIRYALAVARKPERTAEQQRRIEEIIERQVAHMSRLLDDLLDVSRITRGMLQLRKSKVDLAKAIAAAVEAARPLLETKGHVLALDLPAIPIRLHADSVRLTQVFSNLLINAAKYTDPGGRIVLQATQEGPEVVVRVSDNGIGIAAELMPRLFSMFSQAEGATSRAEGGLGIGLAVTRGLVELHGGTVVAESAGERRGSTFTVRLPVEAHGTDGIPPADSRPAAKVARIAT